MRKLTAAAVSVVCSSALLLAEPPDRSELTRDAHGFMAAPANLSAIAEWVRQHSGGMSIRQEDAYVQPKTSLMTWGKATGYIGETPPRYRYNLLTTAGPIMLGSSDDRHHFSRTLATVKVEGDKLIHSASLTFEYPRRGANGGFVFLRSEKVITRVGVIMPDVVASEFPGDDSYPNIRIEQPGAHPYFELDKLLESPKEVLDEQYVVLMNPMQDRALWGFANPLMTELPKSAHIMWFTFGATGELESEFIRPSEHLRMLRESQAARRSKQRNP